MVLSPLVSINFHPYVKGKSFARLFFEIYFKSFELQVE